MTATKTRVTIRNGFYFIGTLTVQDERSVVLTDVEVHNPADPNIVLHQDDVRFSSRIVVSVETVEA